MNIILMYLRPRRNKWLCKISIDHFTIVLQRTDLTIDLVEQFKQVLPSPPKGSELYEIEASADNSDHFYVKHRDGSKKLTKIHSHASV